MLRFVLYHFAPRVSHSQFYLGDDGLDWDPSECWDDDAIERHLAIMDEAIGVGVAVHSGTVIVEVEVLMDEPPLELEPWDQVIDCSLEAPSGRLGVSSPADMGDGMRIAVIPGAYRARVSWGGLHQLHEQLAGQDDPYAHRAELLRRGELRERYRVVLWLASRAESVVHKPFEGPMVF